MHCDQDVVTPSESFQCVILLRMGRTGFWLCTGGIGWMQSQENEDKLSSKLLHYIHAMHHWHKPVMGVLPVYFLPHGCCFSAAATLSLFTSCHLPSTITYIFFFLKSYFLHVVEGTPGLWHYHHFCPQPFPYLSSISPHFGNLLVILLAGLCLSSLYWLQLIKFTSAFVKILIFFSFKSPFLSVFVYLHDRERNESSLC